MEIYNKVKAVPESAQKKITGGRLNGYTDINPMWRIKTLTEQFGACGVGWYYEIEHNWLETGASEEQACFVSINLYIKVDGEWSKPIVGTGGSMFVAKERNGLYTSDECYKMALTDAISVACKALGFGADVYWQNDKSKYDEKPEIKPLPAPPMSEAMHKVYMKEKELQSIISGVTDVTTGEDKYITDEQSKEIQSICKAKWGEKAKDKFFNVTNYASTKWVTKEAFEDVKRKLNEAL